nr:uncharacterized protein LOC117279502 [Nicotiana tomentosiformis]
MQQYVNKVQALLARFKEWLITHILREENVKANTLVNLGSSTEMKAYDSGTVVQLLHSVLDVDGYCEVNTTNLVWDWRNEFVEYLRHGKLPEDPEESRALRTKVAPYFLMSRKLYRRSYQGPLARCLGESEADYVIRDVLEGICGNHSGADSLVLNMVRAGYYWPRMEQDTKMFVQKYGKRQLYAQYRLFLDRGGLFHYLSTSQSYNIYHFLGVSFSISWTSSDLLAQVDWIVEVETAAFADFGSLEIIVPRI